MSSACEVDICGVVGMHALQLARARPARCWIGTTTTATIPTKPSASTAAICPSISSNRRPHGLSGNHRGHRGQGKHVRHLRGPGEIRTDELRAFLHQRSRRHRSEAMSAKASSPTIRWTPSAAPASCGFAKLQDLLRYICERGFEHHVAANLAPVAAAVREATTRYLGWSVYQHSEAA